VGGLLEEIIPTDKLGHLVVEGGCSMGSPVVELPGRVVMEVLEVKTSAVAVEETKPWEVQAPKQMVAMVEKVPDL